MTAAEFKKKWGRSQAKETASYQEHFCDLCRLLGQPTPIEADPSGNDFFCFQKRVVKDAELFDSPAAGGGDEEAERGFADVWKKDCFGWEYKGKKKNLEAAYDQLLQYRESLLNPPLLVVCDFNRYIVRTNFNGTVRDRHEFTNDQIDRPENLRLLRALFEDPGFLKPQRTTAQVTEHLAKTIAEVAKSLQKREAVELADANTRAEMNFAQRKNLRIARFLNRIVFCFFAEDTGLLPKKLFSELLKAGIDDLHHFAETLEKLFAVMATGGTFGKLGFAPAERRLAVEWRTRPVPGQPHTFTGVEIRPLAGHLFQAGVGRDCEPLLLGLCRYGRGGWRLKSFSKTQYAGLHGWEHFRRCHTAVIDLLAGARQLGLSVEINDEGGYWPRRDLETLRRSLEEMNAAVAAAAGVLKDCAEDSGGSPVQSPILAHPRFELLEAEGDARGYASRLRKALGREEQSPRD